MNLADYIQKQRSILLVATGPSRMLASQFRPKFGAVATVQKAILDYPASLGPIDWGLFVDWQPTLECRHAFYRVRKFLCPEDLLSLHDQNDRRTLEHCGIDRQRALTWPVHLQREDAAEECVSSGRLYFPWATTPVLIHALALLRYKSIYCLGCSDLEGKVDAVHEKYQRMCEDVATAVFCRLGCDVRFWKPEDRP